MGKRRHARKQAAGEGQGQDGTPQTQQPQSQPEWVQPSDPPRAVLAVHPQRGVIAVAVGPELRVYDSKSGEHRTLVTKPDQPAPAAQQPAHAARGAVPYVRGAAFDASGSRLLAGSEDKAAGLRLWDASSWELLQSIKVPKKVTNVAFTADGRHMLAADKFGDVLAASTEKPAGLKEGQQQEPEILLGHYCAILTSLSLSSGGRLLATTDRDNRVRVSIVPAQPMEGAHEIQSFCFGHTAFVTCSAFVQHDGQELLVTGGGDGTLRLWEPLEGRLLHTLELPRPEPTAAEPQGEQQQGQQAQQPDGQQAAAGAEQQQQQGQEEEEEGSSGDEGPEEEGGSEEGAEAGGGAQQRQQQQQQQQQQQAAAAAVGGEAAAVAGGALGVAPDDDAAVCAALFRGCVFFLAREVPREPLLFVIRAFGGVAAWEGEGSPHAESDEAVTHQVVDRPVQGHRFLSRAYVQPQWAVDSANARVLLPAELYAPGRAPPPHLSPFVDHEAEGYTPEFAETVARLQEAARRARERAAGLSSEAAAFAEDAAADGDGEDGGGAGGGAQDAAALERAYLRELRREAAGAAAAAEEGGGDGGGGSSSGSEGEEEGGAAGAAARGGGEEDAGEALAAMMMTRKNRKFYERIQRAQAGKAERVGVLEARRAALEKAQGKAPATPAARDTRAAAAAKKKREGAGGEQRVATVEPTLKKRRP